MERLWNRLENNLLDGTFALGKCVHAAEHRATFLTQAGQGQPGGLLLHAYAGSTAETETRYRDWRAVAELAHPALLRMVHTGRTEVDGIPIAYVVTENTDETLAEALRERALTQAEAQQVLVSIAGVLEYVHAHGFAHAHVSPAAVVAVGETIKLDSLDLHRTESEAAARPTGAAGLTSKASAQAEDVRQLGATIYQALTQRAPGAQLERLPQPFDTVVSRCLVRDPAVRPSAREIVTLANPHAVRERAAAAGGVRGGTSTMTAAAAAPVAPAAVSRPSARAGAASAAANPAQRVSAPSGSPAVESNERRLRLGTSPWAILALLVLLAAGIALLLRVSASKTTAPAATARTPVTESPATGAGAPHPPALSAPDTARTSGPLASKSSTQPAARADELPGPAPVVPRATPAPRNPPSDSAAKRSTRSDASTQTPVAPDTTERPYWRVVAYTYARQDDAARKAAELNVRHPDLRAEAFSPGEGQPYLVVLGGRMQRDEATRLRRNAVRQGLPRDTYIQNFAR